MHVSEYEVRLGLYMKCKLKISLTTPWNDNARGINPIQARNCQQLPISSLLSNEAIMAFTAEPTAQEQ